MGELRFEWDPQKNLGNQRKHGIAFPEALTVFYDEEALLLPDPDHSEREDRFILLGMSARLRMLVVCHCYRREETIRIISARRAVRREREQYSQRWKR
jgi:uncharacterized DUF497 family protein